MKRPGVAFAVVVVVATGLFTTSLAQAFGQQWRPALGSENGHYDRGIQRSAGIPNFRPAGFTRQAVGAMNQDRFSRAQPRGFRPAVPNLRPSVVASRQPLRRGSQARDNRLYARAPQPLSSGAPMRPPMFWDRTYSMPPVHVVPGHRQQAAAAAMPVIWPWYSGYPVERPAQSAPRYEQQRASSGPPGPAFGQRAITRFRGEPTSTVPLGHRGSLQRQPMGQPAALPRGSLGVTGYSRPVGTSWRHDGWAAQRSFRPNAFARAMPRPTLSPHWRPVTAPKSAPVYGHARSFRPLPTDRSSVARSAQGQDSTLVTPTVERLLPGWVTTYEQTAANPACHWCNGG